MQLLQALKAYFIRVQILWLVFWNAKMNEALFFLYRAGIWLRPKMEKLMKLKKSRSHSARHSRSFCERLDLDRQYFHRKPTAANALESNGNSMTDGLSQLICIRFYYFTEFLQASTQYLQVSRTVLFFPVTQWYVWKCLGVRWVKIAVRSNHFVFKGTQMMDNGVDSRRTGKKRSWSWDRRPRPAARWRIEPGKQQTGCAAGRAFIITVETAREYDHDPVYPIYGVGLRSCRPPYLAPYCAYRWALAIQNRTKTERAEPIKGGEIIANPLCRGRSRTRAWFMS